MGEQYHPDARRFNRERGLFGSYIGQFSSRLIQPAKDLITTTKLPHEPRQLQHFIQATEAYDGFVHVQLRRATEQIGDPAGMSLPELFNWDTYRSGFLPYLSDKLLKWEQIIAELESEKSKLLEQIYEWSEHNEAYLPRKIPDISHEKQELEVQRYRDALEISRKYMGHILLSAES